VRERGKNFQEYGEWFGANGVFWCAEFVSWAFAKAGHPLPAIDPAKKGASGYYSVQNGRDEAYRRGELFSRPKPGDIFFHFNKGDRGKGHTGIVVDVLPDGRIVTIEGNASPNSGRDGGGVVKQIRPLTYLKGLTFWRVLPPAEDDDRTAADLAPTPSTMRPRQSKKK
jgi:cell wall-associated NlpC family hydrolase